MSNFKIPEKKFIEFCKKNHIKKLSLFGSCLYNNFSPESDIDILVEFDPRYIPGFFKLASLEKALSSIMGNRKVDLRTQNDLSRYFRDEVLSQAEVIYNEKWYG